MYGLQRFFFRKLYWLYGFLKKCTDCTDFFRKLYGLYGFPLKMYGFLYGFFQKSFGHPVYYFNYDALPILFNVWPYNIGALVFRIWNSKSWFSNQVLLSKNFLRITGHFFRFINFKLNLENRLFMNVPRTCNVSIFKDLKSMDPINSMKRSTGFWLPISLF